MKYKIVFIVPYYGKFPGYFHEWVYSAGFLSKENIDFLLITDICIDFPLPNNIKVLSVTFDEFQKRAQEKFDFRIALNSPYKLCDFKPTLGYLFADEIRNYDFWGNCDIDQVWGSVRSFISDDILEYYDRIQFLGHFILYRNTPEMCTLFKKKGAIYDYCHVLSDEMHYSFCEHSGMMKIVAKNHIKNYLAINYADLSPRYTRMIISRQPNYKFQIIYWENGHVIRAFINNSGNVEKDEYMYFHFQRKHPETLNCWNHGKQPLRIIYNANGFIEDIDREITPQYIMQHSDFKSSKIDNLESRKYRKDKIQIFFKSDFKKKILWIKQRLATRLVVSQEEYFGKNYSNSNS